MASPDLDPPDADPDVHMAPARRAPDLPEAGPGQGGRIKTY